MCLQPYRMEHSTTCKQNQVFKSLRFKVKPWMCTDQMPGLWYQAVCVWILVLPLNNHKILLSQLPHLRKQLDKQKFISVNRKHQKENSHKVLLSKVNLQDMTCFNEERVYEIKQTLIYGFSDPLMCYVQHVWVFNSRIDINLVDSKYIYNIFYLGGREREREKAGEGQRERILSRLHTASIKPDTGLKLMNCEVITWAETQTDWTENLTDWATQVPLKLFYFGVTHRIYFLRKYFVKRCTKGKCHPDGPLRDHRPVMCPRDNPKTSPCV